jgi:hypothetical protein
MIYPVELLNLKAWLAYWEGSRISDSPVEEEATRPVLLFIQSAILLLKTPMFNFYFYKDDKNGKLQIAG